MINLIYTPQQSDYYKIEYIIDNDILTVTINDKTEKFDFTGLEEGIAEEIIVETLPFNPITSAEKIGNIVNVNILYIYDIADDTVKSLFEVEQYGRD